MKLVITIPDIPDGDTPEVQEMILDRVRQGLDTRFLELQLDVLGNTNLTQEAKEEMLSHYDYLHSIFSKYEWKFEE